MTNDKDQDNNVVLLAEHRNVPKELVPHIEAAKKFLTIQTKDAWHELCHYVSQYIEKYHKEIEKKYNIKIDPETKTFTILPDKDDE